MPMTLYHCAPGFVFTAEIQALNSPGGDNQQYKDRKEKRHEKEKSDQRRRSRTPHAPFDGGHGLLCQLCI